MSTSERSMALSGLQQRLEAWTQTHDIPSSARPTTMDEISLHLAFLGTRMRALEVSSGGNASVTASEQVLNDARLSCLLLVTSCTRHPDHSLINRLDLLLRKILTDVSRRPRTYSSNTSPSSSRSASSDAAHRSSSRNAPLANYEPNKDATPTLPPLHRLASLFPTSAVLVIARNILGMDSSSRSPHAPMSVPQQREERQHEMNKDIELLEAMLFTFRSNLPTAVVASRGTGIQDFKLGRIIQHLVDIVHAVIAPTKQIDWGDADGDVVGNDMYASEPLPASTSPLLVQNSNSASMATLNYYGSNGYLSPSHLGLSPRVSSVQSKWPSAQDSISLSGTPLLTTANSSYAPSIVPTTPHMADTPFDISQFLHQIDTSSPVTWHHSQGKGELQMHQQQRGPQSVSEPTKRRPGKRQRPDSHDWKESE